MRRVISISCAIVIVACAVPASAQSPALIPNTVPYRVKAPSASTRRSGSVTLTTRAMLRKDGVTELELTTGELDASTPQPGNISKVQVKMTNGDGQLIMVKEYNNLTSFPGYMDFSYTGLARGQRLDVQANVDDIDGSRTDVVNASPVVKLRPDVALQKISAPDSVNPGVPVTISATLAELNHDVGARAACVLSIDGTEVDRADGIWIDAGDLVTCAFTHTFDSPGTRTIKVTAADVVPWDWDLENNEATETILVLRPEENFTRIAANATAADVIYAHHDVSSSRNEYGAYANGTDYETNYYNRTNEQTTTYFANLDRAIAFPITRISLAQSTDGTLIDSATFDDFRPTTSYGGTGWWSACGQVVGNSYRYTYLNVCSFQSAWLAYTYLTYTHYAGEVTYFSSGYIRNWVQYSDGSTAENTYSWNYDSQSQTGTLVPWGSQYSFDVTVSSGVEAYTGPITIPLSPFDYSTIRPWTCSDSSGDWGYRHFCTESTNIRRGLSGYGSWPR